MQGAAIREHQSAFALETRVSGTTRTVTVVGELDLAVADQLDAAVHDALTARPETVVVDLSRAGFVDSTGVSALVRAHHDATQRAIELLIVPAPGRVHHVFTLCGLDSVLPFTAAPSGDEAARSARSVAR
jgi:anti-sigma B factor antagonist